MTQTINLNHNGFFNSFRVLPGLTPGKLRLESHDGKVSISLPANLFPFLKVGCNDPIVTIFATLPEVVEVADTLDHLPGLPHLGRAQ
jgi:hypothetical protein